MDCPVCNNVKLVMSERQGIEIDYCPNCRGVWLDRGELDKIIDKSTEGASQPVRQQSRNDPYQQPPQPQQPHGFGHSQPPQAYPRDDYYRKKRKKSFLGDLFDFD